MTSTLFKTQLTHWTVHTSICAAPSFILAILAGFRSPGSIVAMLLGICTMILMYSVVSCHPRFGGTPEGILYKAAHCGARFRTVTCLLEIPLFAMAPVTSAFAGFGMIMLMPDGFAGLAALHLVGLSDKLGRMNPSGTVGDFLFLRVYSATVIEAVMVSGTIFILFSAGFGLVRIIRIKSKSTPTPTEASS